MWWIDNNAIWTGKYLYRHNDCAMDRCPLLSSATNVCPEVEKNSNFWE